MKIIQTMCYKPYYCLTSCLIMWWMYFHWSAWMFCFCFVFFVNARSGGEAPALSLCLKKCCEWGWLSARSVLNGEMEGQHKYNREQETCLDWKETVRQGIFRNYNTKIYFKMYLCNSVVYYLWVLLRSLCYSFMLNLFWVNKSARVHQLKGFKRNITYNPIQHTCAHTQYI